MYRSRFGPLEEMRTDHSNSFALPSLVDDTASSRGDEPDLSDADESESEMDGMASSSFTNNVERALGSGHQNNSTQHKRTPSTVTSSGVDLSPPATSACGSSPPPEPPVSPPLNLTRRMQPPANTLRGRALKDFEQAIGEMALHNHSLPSPSPPSFSSSKHLVDQQQLLQQQQEQQQNQLMLQLQEPQTVKTRDRTLTSMVKQAKRMMDDDQYRRRQSIRGGSIRTVQEMGT